MKAELLDVALCQIKSVHVKVARTRSSGVERLSGDQRQNICVESERITAETIQGQVEAKRF